MAYSLTLSVIVVNWNVRDLLRDCLRSLHEQMLIPPEAWEVIVVDNDSSDGSAAMVERDFPQAVLLANSRNVGFAPANNQAFRISRGKYVLLLNPDTVILDHAVDCMVGEMDRSPDVAALGCRLLNSDGSFQRWTGGNPPTLPNVACHFLFAYKVLPRAILPRPLYLETDPKQDLDVGWVSGACMLLRREALAGTIFDERFFLYGEDFDLCDRLARAGWRVVYTPKARIMHYAGRSLERQSAEIQVSKLRSLRQIFASRHGLISLLLYDLVVVVGFLLRSIAFGLAERARPGRGYNVDAAKSRQYFCEACRALVRR